MKESKNTAAEAFTSASEADKSDRGNKTNARMNFPRVMDQVDEARAVRLRTEYGRVKWLVSWYAQEDGFWLARLSCPHYEDTVEALGQSRCLAIDSATRHLLDNLHRQAAEKDDA